MTHDEYTTAVDEGRWPSTPTVPLPGAFENDAGWIANLLLKPVRSVAAIRSRAGSVRANHYHRTDWHYAYVVSGRVLYFERAVGAKEIPRPLAYHPGDMFFTPPGREHAMLFPESTLILTFAKNVRSHEEHEADLVRVEFVTPDVAATFLELRDELGR